MIAIQLDKTQKTPFLVEALDGAHIKYTKMLSEERTLWHTPGRKSVLEYYGEFMEAVNHSYSDGNRDEQLLTGMFIGHMTPSLRDALEKRKM